MGDKTGPSNLGVVVSVRGSVVDICFDAYLPPIYALLHAMDGEIAIEVLAQLDAHRVRGIALTPTQGLARGMAVEDTGGPLKAPVGKGILSRMFDVFGNTIDREEAPTDVTWRSVHRAPPALARRSTKSEIFETGIKVIDVLLPLERGGKAGLFGARLDEDTRKIIEHGRRIRACLKQPEFDPVSVPAQIAVLLALTAERFDDVPLDRMTDAEQAVRKAAAEIPAQVRERLDTAEKLSDSDRETIIQIARQSIEAFLMET